MPLDAEQTSRFRERLREQHAQLRAEIRDELSRSDAENYGTLAGQVHDSGEESIADLLADVNIALVDRQVNEVRAIEAALQRIAEGSYGICSGCGEDIPAARLEADPAVERCIDCQTALEERGAGPGQSSL